MGGETYVITVVKVFLWQNTPKKSHIIKYKELHPHNLFTFTVKNDEGM